MAGDLLFYTARHRHDRPLLESGDRFQCEWDLDVGVDHDDNHLPCRELALLDLLCEHQEPSEVRYPKREAPGVEIGLTSSPP